MLAMRLAQSEHIIDFDRVDELSTLKPRGTVIPIQTYVLPKATDMPAIEIDQIAIETETDTGLSARGVGESGMIIAPAALAKAVSDALQIQITELSTTPEPEHEPAAFGVGL